MIELIITHYHTICSGQLHVPEEVPVDLRVKLAVSMIFLGQSLPDVSTL